MMDFGKAVPVSYTHLLGRHVLLTAVKNIGRGQVFDENFLMAVATIGAWAVSYTHLDVYKRQPSKHFGHLEVASRRSRMEANSTIASV